MTCAACIAFDAAERAAIEGQEMPEPDLDGCTCEERPLDVLFVSPEAFRVSPQRGEQRRPEWDSFAAFLSRPSIGDSKDIAGGYALGSYGDGIRRKANLASIGGLVVDVDENGDVDRVADAVSNYRAIVHETFSSTNDAPRCRLILALEETIDAATYDPVHRVVRTHLRVRGIQPDDGAKDCSRLSYSPVRRADAGYRFRVTTGRPLSAARLLVAQKPKPKPEKRPASTEPIKHPDSYKQAALRAAAASVSKATPGGRHHALLQAVWGLARPELALDEETISRALLDAFVAAAGEARRTEAHRAIANAYAARRHG
jgi:hypothetical protein